MANPRLPKVKAEASGAALKNPGRHKDRKGPVAVRPVGKPYVGMTAHEVRYWDEFVRELPWLHSGHRVLLRIACRLSAGLDGDDFGVSKAQALSSILSKLGATPVDETKVNHDGSGESQDPGEGFFGRPN